MAGIIPNTSPHPTGNAFIDGLIAGGPIWNVATGPIVVKIASSNGASGDGGWQEAIAARGTGRGINEPDEFLRNGTDPLQWELFESRGLTQAASALEAVCGIKFQFTSSFAAADVAWWKALRVDDFSPGASFIHEGPTPRSQQQTWGYFEYLTEGHWDYTPGTLGFQKMMAFAAKGVGLALAHEGGFPGVDDSGDRGLFDLNASPFTMMSFNDKPQDSFQSGGYGFLKTPSAIDIAALQALYGVNGQTAAGNSRYELPAANDKGTGWTTIWDTGGIDTISGERSSSPVSINLNAASLAAEDPHAAGYFSRQINIYGGFSIANGVVIENAVGGTGNDLLVGNAAANVISGGLGNDTLKGFGGKDSFRFSGKPNSKKNWDKIVDYSVADDTIQLDRKYFSKIATKKGTLKSKEFWKGKAAHDGNDHVIYNPQTGDLFYDPDGNGNARAVKFANVGKKLKLSALDFEII